MKERWIKRLLPRGLYGRAALIGIVPLLTLQLVVSIVFIERHFRDVTVQMSSNVAREINLLRRIANEADSPDGALMAMAPIVESLSMEVVLPSAARLKSARLFYDYSGRFVIESIKGAVPRVLAVDLIENDKRVHILMETEQGRMQVVVPRVRFSASNPHQLLVLMVLTGALMGVIGYLFLRNQFRPIKRLAMAAEAFGKGRSVYYRPSGATEVRAAGRAFLDMRARIERQIEQRTLMLSGVSHDLRTPLTRLRLALSLVDESDDTKDMLRDLDEMERMLDAFLDFARADALDDLGEADPVAMLRDIAARSGDVVELGPMPDAVAVKMRPLAVSRAVQNLVNNALVYGTRCRVSLDLGERSLRITVEDNGPGIPADKRELAMQPFSRLDASRNQNRRSGVGLGLAIAADIARGHGGRLRLDDSADLGGLKAELMLAR